ncbi:MAG: NYN domain-containing protein, partial [Streptosporangiaceae bacterium]
MDRCALFVDASYALADGAMAVHGTRQRESVSWDYAGLVKLFTGLSRDRTGLPVLRCYWYEATVEGRRSSEHNALADLPGVKLRLGRVRPGRREGVEAEMHRDLTTLARNHVVSDAVIVSAEEDLTEVVAEVQDLGLRVVIVHIAAEGNWTVARPLRQESDDIVEVTGAHLRPFVDLIPAAGPSDADEQYRNGNHQRRSLTNGHGNGIGAVTHQGLPAAALPPGPTIYDSPVAEDYQQTSAGAPQSAAAGQPQAPAAQPQEQAP